MPSIQYKPGVAEELVDLGKSDTSAGLTDTSAGLTKVWRDVKLPAGKILIPGVVSHATNLVEHPELVACSRGCSRYPQIAWPKQFSGSKVLVRSENRTAN